MMLIILVCDSFYTKPFTIRVFAEETHCFFGVVRLRKPDVHALPTPKTTPRPLGKTASDYLHCLNS